MAAAGVEDTGYQIVRMSRLRPECPAEAHAMVTTREDATMPRKNDPMPFKLGDRVKIRRSDMRGRIVELRGALGPGGVNIYRIRLHEKPRPACIEVREDQLIHLPAKPRQNGAVQHRKTPGA
jgi:hypothetical protein